MESLLENALGYVIIIGIGMLILFFYLKHITNRSKKVREKLENAVKFGFHEPVSLHPVVDPDKCIGSGACIDACPEQDILGIIDGQAHVINASRCVGHGACFHACPVGAITLCIGTEKRGVDLPHISREFETNIPGLYIAGELGGMGLIKNAVEQGKQAVNFLSAKIKSSVRVEYDIIIVGAGPAGIAASLAAAKNKMKYLTLEQDSLGGTVYNFPRAKIVMTSPMDLPLHGKIKLGETSKQNLLQLWDDVLKKNKIIINEYEKVESIEKNNGNFFEVKTNKGVYASKGVILAIGRRGSPRKLNVPGENKEKVAYRLLEPELIKDSNILIVGGGDSAIESALLLSDENRVTISYRSEAFSRIKPKNFEFIIQAIDTNKVKVIFNSNVREILDDKVTIKIDGRENYIDIKNDLVYVFAGGILPTDFLQQVGVKITKKFGDVVLQHDDN
jgi:thioredoxin reductase/NAD-dependent dihydropyrimidine dehydrogenase PreA subunit